MTRAEFLARLRRGLVGLPATTANEIVNDYEAHFADGAAAGRSEAEVAAALGDPDRLARELKAEAGAQRWRQEPSASSAAAAVFGILGLGAIDILILLPIALPVFGTVLSILVAGIAVFIAGGFVLVAGPFVGAPGGALAAALLGVGLMGMGIFMVGTMALLTKWLIDATVWYARLHYRVIKPALEPQA
ncbi:DUF1700 domain-containing protein [Brevundimonas naejangsanensis]|uniref:DUF1700 domain-containing protein n=1 Tax=Brevundimonas naejangsanensis TaxID=588932 RepID=A0A494RFJ3_9CAUL|nr:DUF1700 domain-containing protein [Brevundimonas naejangsanensis]AYG95108.1 DUF1700 domain-containing protein [Brevundimonas naejangsanensis]